ncbi:integrase catalytic domain-containing protein [Trichonephila inaurata madagascariensis]|uniref:Integrase catalytic domain-containing protein n=1 Tax=Trichonephila inaurata madagascariensis TaxID=2747483 RepID=A0A8X6WT48_9ARAC|nr:integrase catalytic domain-containing protein [Trichonephila inaurata madagascariensis]
MCTNADPTSEGQGSGRSLDRLMTFLRKQVESEEMILLARAGLGSTHRQRLKATTEEPSLATSTAFVLSEIKEKGIIVPDLCNSVNEIDMLLGTDVINVILSGRTIKLMSGLIAIGTMLGFTLMEKVPETEFETDAYYLPHTAVSKISETTKIRPIFNATSREGNNPSLYDCLLSGPNLIELIPDILDRFRMYCIGLSADIEKAFLQISVTPEHRDFLRFFLSS